MVVAHATVLRLITSPAVSHLSGGTGRRPIQRVQQLAALTEVGGSSRMPQRTCIDCDSCEVRRQRGGTPRAEGVFPPVFPLLFPF